MAKTKLEKRRKIKRRVRGKIYGTTEQPRLSVFRSNKDIYAQIINDEEGLTLAAFSSITKDLVNEKGTKSEISQKVGEHLAKLAIEKGVKKVVFDRNGYRYHGRVKALADGARAGGLEF